MITLNQTTLLMMYYKHYYARVTTCGVIVCLFVFCVICADGSICYITRSSQQQQWIHMQYWVYHQQPIAEIKQAYRTKAKHPDHRRDDLVKARHQ
jgi:hypothetical protein